MVEETKVPVVPETTVDEPLIENRRAEIEKLVETENATFPEPELLTEKSETETEQKGIKTEEETIDPVEQMKKSVQKRINKVVAQKKSVEEELADVRAENERLRASLNQPEPPVPKEVKTDAPPTLEQVKAYIVKMRQEGNINEELAAFDYLVELKKNQALKEVEEKQTQAQKSEQAKKDQQLSDWIGLQRDYENKDNPELDISNQKGILYIRALALYNDKEIHAHLYNEENPILGFRRAVADAFREIHQQGLVKTPKGEINESRRTNRAALADPDATANEETTQSTNSNSLSDAEVVREEIKNRNKNRFYRPRSQ